MSWRWVTYASIGAVAIACGTSFVGGDGPSDATGGVGADGGHPLAADATVPSGGGDGAIGETEPDGASIVDGGVGLVLDGDDSTGDDAAFQSDGAPIDELLIPASGAVDYAVLGNNVDWITADSGTLYGAPLSSLAPSGVSTREVLLSSAGRLVAVRGTTVADAGVAYVLVAGSGAILSVPADGVGGGMTPRGTVSFPANVNDFVPVYTSSATNIYYAVSGTSNGTNDGLYHLDGGRLTHEFSPSHLRYGQSELFDLSHPTATSTATSLHATPLKADAGHDLSICENVDLVNVGGSSSFALCFLPPNNDVIDYYQLTSTSGAISGSLLTASITASGLTGLTFDPKYIYWSDANGIHATSRSGPSLASSTIIDPRHARQMHNTGDYIYYVEVETTDLRRIHSLE